MSTHTPGPWHVANGCQIRSAKDQIAKAWMMRNGEGLANAKRTKEQSEVFGEFLAIDSAMNKLQPGELCLVLVDQVEEAMAHIAAKVASDT